MKKIRYLPWIKRSGRWHIFKVGESVTLCGMPMLGCSHPDMPVERLVRCDRCHDAMASILRQEPVARLVSLVTEL